MMNLSSPYMKIFIRMQKYGIMFGALAGALIVFALFLPMVLENLLYLGYVAFLSAPIGGFAGMILGGFIGFVSGGLMMVTTALFFRRGSAPTLYQVIVGLLVFAFTTMLVIQGTAIGLSNPIPDSEFLRPLPVAIILAVYTSQIVARQYLREVNVRKQK